jgi:ABC-type antimicrobial peptide transport system permease subunit
MINASAARLYWPEEDAVGKILMRGREEDRVIGIVDDVHEETVEGGSGSQIYYPAMQQRPASAQLVVRTRFQPAALAPSVLHTLRELNPNQPAAEFRPIQKIVDRAVSPRRFFILLVAAFASLGLLLAALGIYGVVSHSVTQRTQEIGIRMALGATTSQVQFGIFGNTLLLTSLGVVIGGIASLLVTRTIATLLFATSSMDPGTFASVIFTLAFVSLLSGYLPARKASRINPMVALRND